MDVTHQENAAVQLKPPCRCVCLFVQDGEEWIFTVRKFESLPERTTVVNYDGFAEGICFHPLACAS